MSEPITSPMELSRAECFELLAGQELGRLAWVEAGDSVAMVPVNFAVDDEAIVFRTAPGSKLAAVVADRAFAFESDAIVGEEGWSVVVRGHARLLDPVEEGRLEQLGLRAWLGGEKPHLVSLAADEVTGRRYPLRRPWKRMMR